MSRWPMVPLGQFMSLRPPDIEVLPEVPYHFAGVYCFGKGLFSGQKKLGTEFRYNRLTQLRSGDFVYPKLMAWEGALAVVPVDFDGLYVSPEFPVFEIDQLQALPKFLDFYFRRPSVWPELSGGSTGTNVRRRRLHPDNFLRFRVHLPPLAEQRRLVERIDALAAKVEEAKGLRQQADEKGNRLLSSMAHRLDLSSEDKCKAGWREVTLGTVIRLSPHPVPVDTGGSYPNLGIFSFGRGLFPKPPIDGLATSARTLFRVHPGQFIYSRLFAFEGAYGIVTGEYDDHFVSNEYPTFDLDSDKVHPAFLHAYFKAPRIWGEIAAGSKGLGDRRQRVHPEQVLAHRLHLPPLDWQHHIAAIQMKLDGEENNRQAVGTELDAMLPAILDRAFKGDL